MSILNPEHLFEQASRLIGAGVPGQPRQVDVRRAISAVYYGLFHAILTAAADLVVGQSQRATARYGLVYRRIEHGALRQLCDQVQKPIPEKKYQPYVPQGGFGPEIRHFSAAVMQRQDRRHNADYDPMIRVYTVDALSAIAQARGAMQQFGKAKQAERELFLTLLLFPPR